ncbi:phosphohydrolase [Pontibacillus chungwhensis BH030062]|uniref:Phosphohydrolase n=1 Tax=Pontibacillus chungwhensis BH030062 TaxID=1385513 RepID=A0A0A2VGD8_9BACI|nr:HD-GYP domain-containing protein [Pontibacillus chungwhensis]KGP92695.1 phosphohydrolase [Pontibacillus chungwhensis BH030062]
MRVHPGQLIPGCIVMSNVMGKTNSPIVSKNTVVKPIHITILHKFLIEEVEVGQKLSNGSPFLPKKVQEEPEGDVTVQELERTDFRDQYLYAVQSYKKMFQQWQAGLGIDISAVRRVIVPLIEQVSQHKNEVYSLHHYTSKHDYFYHHGVAVALLSALIAEQLQYSKGEQIQVGIAGFLSDCGMSKIDEKITLKKGPLTSYEYNEIKKHPTYSYRLVEKVPALKNEVRLGVLQHHERLDGSGYPLGISSNKLHKFGKIIAVADLYHAMTSERVYRSKQSPFKVLEELLQQQFGKFDPTVIQKLVQSMTSLSSGMKVRLSNNQIAEIVFIESKHPTRPMVRLHHSDEIIHLKYHRDLYIEEIIS